MIEEHPDKMVWNKEIYIKEKKVKESLNKIRDVIQNCSNLDTELVGLFTQDIDDEMKELRI